MARLAATGTFMFLAALSGIGMFADTADAACVLCRCIYATDASGAPVRTSSPFQAQGVPDCVSMCNETRINCVFPGACYPVTSRRIFEVLGQLPEIQCPRPPPYTAPFNRRSLAY
jgi:hypothetical protein